MLPLLITIHDVISFCIEHVDRNIFKKKFIHYWFILQHALKEKSKFVIGICKIL